MAKAGIDKLRIIDVGRWKTLSVLERYLKAAQYKKVVSEVSELADEFTVSSTALEDGLKDVKEFLSPGIGEAVESSDWTCHQGGGRHVAVDSSAGLLRRCPGFQSGQLGQRVGDSSKKRCGEAWDGAGGKHE